MLIESSGGPSDERFNSNEQARKGEITLKAVKMSRIVNSGQGGSGNGEQHLVYPVGNHHPSQ